MVVVGMAGREASVGRVRSTIAWPGGTTNGQKYQASSSCAAGCVARYRAVSRRRSGPQGASGAEQTLSTGRAIVGRAVCGIQSRWGSERETARAVACTTGARD